MIWGGASASNIDPVNKLQKRTIRLIAGLHYLAHTDPLFARMKILKITDIYKFIIAQYMFHIILAIFVIAAIKLTLLGMLIRLPHCLTLSKRSLYQIGPQIWNSLLDNIRKITCLSLFKGRTKRYFI